MKNAIVVVDDDPIIRMDIREMLLTAYSHKELVKDAREAGVAAFLVKPVSEEDGIEALTSAAQDG